MRRLHPSGFTIIELIVAVAVTVIIVGITVPRYNKYEDMLVFQRTGQDVAACVARAQTLATLATDPSGGATSRFTEARLSVASGAIACSIRTYGSATTISQITDGSATALSDTTMVNASTVALTSVKVSRSGVETVTNKATVGSGYQQVSVYFGSAERGLPVATFCDSTCTAWYPGAGNPAKDVPLGTGVRVEMTLSDSYNSAESTNRGTLSISQTGLPITYAPTD